MYKRIVPLLIAVTILIQGCAKIETSEYIKAPVYIRDAIYEEGGLRYVGGIYRHEEDEFWIVVIYKGAEYYLRDKDTYYAFKDRVGEITDGIFRLDFYDNGLIQYNIVGLD